MTQPLVIVGAGGFGRETAAAVDAVNQQRPTWHLLGFLDDDPTLRGRALAGTTVLGGLDVIAGLDEDTAVVVCLGNPRDFSRRERVVDRLGLPSHRYATVIHPSAAIAPDCLVDPGCVVLAHATLTAGVTLGAHVAVMPQVVLTHDDVVEEFATLTSGVRLGGGVHIGRGAYIGAGALIRESVRVGARALVGMGSVVLHDVPAGQVWAGNPARYLRAAVPTVAHPRAGSG
jgi:sugar O-acyltransferase (sialic acid O-acetyltransferase NeuD family)